MSQDSGAIEVVPNPPNTSGSVERMTAQRIYKYPFPPYATLKELQLPEDAEVLHVGEDPNSRRPALWARVTPDAPVRTRVFFLAATGEELVQERLQYIGTVVLSTGYVWHVHEVLPEGQLSS